MKNKKNILIIIFVILGMYFALSFKDHNFKRAVDALVGSLLTPTIAIVLYFERISLIFSFTTYSSI